MARTSLCHGSYLGFANFTRVERKTVVQCQGIAQLDDVLTAWYLVLLSGWGIRDPLPAKDKEMMEWYIPYILVHGGGQHSFAAGCFSINSNVT